MVKIGNKASFCPSSWEGKTFEEFKKRFEGFAPKGDIEKAWNLVPKPTKKKTTKKASE